MISRTDWRSRPCSAVRLWAGYLSFLDWKMGMMTQRTLGWSVEEMCYNAQPRAKHRGWDGCYSTSLSGPKGLLASFHFLTWAGQAFPTPALFRVAWS